MKLIFNLVILLACITNLSAQQRLLYQGKIVSKISNIPIPYATIKVINKNAITISNADGDFMLSGTAIQDSILVSAVGFITSKFAIDNSKTSRFELLENVVSLSDVNVKPLNAIDILKSALNTSDLKIPKSQIIDGYYKEYVKRDSFITKYADGIISYYVERKNEDELKIDLRVLQSRAKILPVASEDDKYDAYSSFITIKDQAKLITARDLQPFKNANFEYYNYQISEINDNGIATYLVKFKPKKGDKNALFEGTISIDKDQGVITSVDYKVAKVSESYLKSINILGIKASLRANSLHLVYTNTSEGYCLAYLSRVFDMEISSKTYNQLNSFKSEFFVTKVQTKNLTPFTDNTYNKRNLYKRGTQYQKEYWKESNIIMNTSEESSFLK